MNRIIFASTLLLIILIIPSPVFADGKTLYLTITVDRNLDIVEYDIFTLNQTVQSYSNKTIYGTMNIEMHSYNDEVLFSAGFSPDFYVMTNPPTESDRESVILVLPYIESAQYVKVYKNNTETLSLDIMESICNNNGVCDNFENHYSCPPDCSLYSKDGVCASISLDGGCDPDCPPQIDLDCSCPNRICEDWENYKLCPRDCLSGGSDDYCDKLDDRKCDPDCNRKEDIDCTCPDQFCQWFETQEACPQDCNFFATTGEIIKENWLYLILVVIAFIIIIVVVKKKKRKPKKNQEWGTVYRKMRKQNIYFIYRMSSVFPVSNPHLMISAVRPGFQVFSGPDS
jgi:hypothetical protein